jgi:hypothetical protein
LKEVRYVRFGRGFKVVVRGEDKFGIGGKSKRANKVSSGTRQGMLALLGVLESFLLFLFNFVARGLTPVAGSSLSLAFCDRALVQVDLLGEGALLRFLLGGLLGLRVRAIVASVLKQKSSQ